MLVLRGFEMDVGDQYQIDLVAQFDLGDVGALFVEQEGGDVDRHLAVQCSGVFFHGLFFEDAQDMQRRRFGAERDVAGAVAARAGDVAGFGKSRTQALAGQFEQAEAADLAGLHAGAVVAQGVAQAVLDFALVLLDSMSMKSMTTRPPRSRRRSWRAISSAASQLVLKAVSSMSAPRVARPELTSTETRASVWSITMAPPEGRLT
jgi:hypothetical protein